MDLTQNYHSSVLQALLRSRLVSIESDNHVVLTARGQKAWDERPYPSKREGTKTDALRASYTEKHVEFSSLLHNLICRQWHSTPPADETEAFTQLADLCKSHGYSCSRLYSEFRMSKPRLVRSEHCITVAISGRRRSPKEWLVVLYFHPRTGFRAVVYLE